MHFQERQQIKSLQEAASPGAFSRREVIRRGIALGLAAPAISTLIGACAEDDDETEGPAVDPDDDDADDHDDTLDDHADEDPDTADDIDDEADDVDEDDRYGGTLNVATIGEPVGFDIHSTTNATLHLIAGHMYEFLYTWDAELQPVPELAETTEVSDDGLTIEIKLLEDVNFHNGDQLTVTDVIASLERWSSISGLGENLMEATDEIIEVDDYNIQFEMNTAFGPFQPVLAFVQGGCAIFPASVMEESTSDNLAEVIGTGPYQFVEHAVDRYIHLERFDDYTNRDEDTSGFSGYKPQYLDEIYFRPVPDTSARVAGLQTGDYHHLQDVPSDQQQTLEDDPDINALVGDPIGKIVLVLNTREGIMSDVTMRRAVQAALDHDPLMLAGYGEGFYRVDSSNMMQESPWHTNAGEDVFNQNDPDRAAELLEEAGYDGEPIRLMSSREQAPYFALAQLAEQQLTAAGFNVDLQEYDWATVHERRGDPELWEIFTTGLGFRPDPQTITFMQGTEWPGWWDSDEKVDLTRQMQSESDFDVRYEIWEQLEELFYEEVPIIQVGDYRMLRVARDSVQNFEQALEVEQLRVVLNNVWLDD